jgi:hypothetical protein
MRAGWGLLVDGVIHQPTIEVAAKAHRLLNASKVKSLRATKKWSLPDILMVVPPKEAKGKTTIHLVELEYTRDNAPEEAADKAEQQHAELVKALQTHNTNCNVKLRSPSLWEWEVVSSRNLSTSWQNLAL